MGSAFFLMAVNFCVAMIFSVLFLVLATKSPSRQAALMLAIGFAISSYSAIAEAMLLVSDFTRFFALGAFASVLAGICVIVLAIGEYYKVPVSRLLLLAVFVAGAATAVWIFDLPRGTPGHSFPYQMPFFVVLAIGASAVYRSQRRSPADRVLLGLLILSALYFPLKAYVAVAVGAGRDAHSYLFSDFAVVSQGLGAILIVATGLVLVWVLVREIIDEADARSETDPLSGLLNRRGFGRQVQPLLQYQGQPLSGTLILADLDHFKRINDQYGHHAGDEVIQAFARLLRSWAPEGAAVGRIGGEEFAIYLPVSDVESGQALARGVRAALAASRMKSIKARLKITASWGGADVAPGETLESVMRRADGALYAAKAAGRDRVVVADPVGRATPGAIAGSNR